MADLREQAHAEIARRLQTACRELTGLPAWRLVKLHLYALARQKDTGERAAGVYDAIARIEGLAEAELNGVPEVVTGATHG